MLDQLWADVEDRIGQITRRILREEIEKRWTAAQVVPTDWMTEVQLAEYWQLTTDEGKPTVHSIRKWTARPSDQHPLPCAQMGDKRRYHRKEVDKWAREENELKRAQRKLPA